MGDWNAKVGSQEIPGVIGPGVQNEAGQTLTDICQENALISANILFQQHKRQPYTCTSWSGQDWKQTNYIICSQRWRHSIRSAKTGPGPFYGSDHQRLIAKFRLKLKKVGKTTRLFRYDPNQILYDYTAEVTNRSKRLDLVDKVPEELWTEVCNRRQWPKPSQRKRNARRQRGCLKKL